MDTLGRDGLQGKSFQQRPDLVIAEGRGLAFVSVDLRSFDPMPRVAAGHRIAFQQVVEQAGQRRQFATDGGAGHPLHADSGFWPDADEKSHKVVQKRSCACPA